MAPEKMSPGNRQQGMTSADDGGGAGGCRGGLAAVSAAFHNDGNDTSMLPLLGEAHGDASTGSRYVDADNVGEALRRFGAQVPDCESQIVEVPVADKCIIVLD